ncbi:MAG: trypsin-like peptidase domain-containing protein [Pyrinomonadaceae bacterium]
MRRLSLVALFTLFLVAAVFPMQRSFVGSAVSEGERLAMHSKPSVVRIVDGVAGSFYFDPPNRTGKNYDVSFVGLGSGFFINSSGYIATNAHVVSVSHDIKQKGQDAALDILFYQLLQQVARHYNADPKALTRENIAFIRNHTKLTGLKHYHHVVIPDGSVYEFEEKQFGAPTGQGKDVAIIKIEVRNAPVLIVGDSEKMSLQDHVVVIGYPGAADTFNSGILDSKSTLEASITDGKVSARKKSAGGAPILQISAPATHGNSGGPVMTDQREVIGLLTFGGDRVNGQEISGFDFVVPSSTVMEFVKAAGVANEIGPADKAYQEGLELYWDQRYSNAIPKFEEVRRLFPEHSEVTLLIQGSQQAITEGRDQSGLPTWLIVVVVLVVLFIGLVVIGGGLGAFFIVRKRRNQKPVTRAPFIAPPASAKPAISPAFATPEVKPAPPPPPPPPAPSPSTSQGPSAPAPKIPTPGPVKSDTADVDFSRTVAIIPEPEKVPVSYGSIKFISGLLTGQQFDVIPEGACIGREATLSQIVINDPRISKRHLWIGVRDGRVVIADQGSRNGSFLNDPKSPRITEAALEDGDMVILGESDVVRFEYKK